MTSEVLVFACTECGCEDIQGTAWVHLNSNQILDNEPPNDAIWCPNCDSETSVALFDRNDPERKDTWQKGRTVPVFKKSGEGSYICEHDGKDYYTCACSTIGFVWPTTVLEK